MAIAELQREPIKVAGDELQEQLAIQAEQQLGYNALRDHLGLAGPLRRALHALEIQPYSKKSVLEYKISMADQFMRAALDAEAKQKSQTENSREWIYMEAANRVGIQPGMSVRELARLIRHEVKNIQAKRPGAIVTIGDEAELRITEYLASNARMYASLGEVAGWGYPSPITAPDIVDVGRWSWYSAREGNTPEKVPYPVRALQMQRRMLATVWSAVDPSDVSMANPAGERFQEYMKVAKWMNYQMRGYHGHVPDFALEMAIQVSTEVAEKTDKVPEFGVDTLVMENRYLDPFLAVRLDDEIEFIAVWDEPEFEKENPR